MNGHDSQPAAILLDAVGTLIYPEPPVATAYAQIARRHRMELPEDEIQRRFKLAFRAQETIDEAAGLRTTETRERERWRAIVGEVFADQARPLAPFEELWNHFAEPRHWASFPEVKEALAEAAERGVRLVVASNFDARLGGIVAGLPELAPIRGLFVSSEVGWNKPATEFYRHCLGELGLSAGDAISVGDDRDNDVAAPRRIGIRAALVARSAGVDLRAALRLAAARG